MKRIIIGLTVLLAIVSVSVLFLSSFKKSDEGVAGGEDAEKP